VGERADYVSTSHVRVDSGSGGASGSAADADPEVIAADIEATRDEMSSTIEAIQERLDPERLSQQAVSTATEVSEQAVTAATEITEQAREAAKDVAKYAIEEAKAAVNELTGQAKASVREATIGKVEHMAMYTRDTAESVKGDLWTTIKQNPVPAALAAIGIGWLWSNRSGGGSQRSSSARYGNYRGETHSDWSYQSSGAGSPYYGSYGTEGGSASSGTIGGYGSSGTHGRQFDQQDGQGQQMGGQIMGQAQERVGQVQEKAGQVVGQAGQVVGQVPYQMRERAGQVQQQAQGFWQMMESNPVAVGALGTVLGGVAGLLIPETEKENQLMGEARDRVVGSVQEMAGETVAKAQLVAEEAGRSAMEAGQAAIEEVNSQQGSMGQSGSGQRGSGKSGSGSGASSTL
jgi:Protein of unknown function (DUF3618)